MSDPVEVLDFWLGEVGPEGWYAVDPELDALIRHRFGELWQAALDGGLAHWAEGVAGSLALLVVTDQFPRNMFRGEARAFATDPLAREVARKAVAEGWDLEAPEPDRQFFYLPFEHSEDPADQQFAVDLISERLPASPESALHARAHQSIIAHFGRFPFRNAALGRDSTVAEQEFLEGGGYASMVNDLRATSET